MNFGRFALRVIASVSLVAVAACVSLPKPSDFRDTEVPISATTRFTPENFQGKWHVVARYPNRFLPDCDQAQWTIDDTSSLQVACPDNAGPVLDVPVAVDPTGILQVATPELTAKSRAFVVMWMDAELRIATIGTVSGEMGWILSRTGDIRPDKLKAAQEIMRFNGYDISQMIVGAK
ncbi:MAG: lipocalin family protein [Sulfitobacter sp.]